MFSCLYLLWGRFEAQPRESLKVIRKDKKKEKSGMGGSWCGFILSIYPLMALLSPGNSILAGWCRTFPAGVLGPGEGGSPLGASPQPVTSRCFITTELSQSRRVAQNVRGGERPRGHRKFGNFSWVTEWAATLQHVVCHCA